MLGYELSIHEIVPFDVFIFICRQKKRQKNREKKNE